jgi:hypothetical protein
MPMPFRAVSLTVCVAAFVIVAGCGGSKTVLFSDSGIEFRYPVRWSVSGFSRTVLPACLVGASYGVTRGEVEGDCGGSRALTAIPHGGAAALLIDYGPGAANAAEFAPRPKHFLLERFAPVNVECFGDGYMLHFKAAGHNLQALVKLGKDADSSTRDQALRSSIRSNVHS